MPVTPSKPLTPPDGWTDVEDVRLTAEHRRLKTQLHQQLVANMNLAAINTVDQETLRAEVRRVLEELCNRSSSLINRAARERLVTEVLDETFGLGPLEPLMADPAVTDILINGHSVVYVERHGRRERADAAFNDEPPSAEHRPAASWAAWAAASMRPAQWWTAACRTAVVLTQSSRPWPWTARLCRSAASAFTPSWRTTSCGWAP